MNKNKRTTKLCEYLMWPTLYIMIFSNAFISDNLAYHSPVHILSHWQTYDCAINLYQSSLETWSTPPLLLPSHYCNLGTDTTRHEVQWKY